jgi:hypothetical protein
MLCEEAIGPLLLRDHSAHLRGLRGVNLHRLALRVCCQRVIPPSSVLIHTAQRRIEIHAAAVRPGSRHQHAVARGERLDAIAHS